MVLPFKLTMRSDDVITMLSPAASVTVVASAKSGTNSSIRSHKKKTVLCIFPLRFGLFVKMSR